MATFENLQIKRLIAHEVVLASALDRDVQPVMSDTLTLLVGAGKDLVSRRLAEALGDGSHSIEVAVERDEAGSVFATSAGLLDAPDTEFIAASKQLADRLSRAQNVGSIKSGVALVIHATVGPDTASKRLLVIVKAESDAAFIKRKGSGGLTLEFVGEMVFGAQQRLFKIGAFLENRSPTEDDVTRQKRDFATFVYDHQLNIKGAGLAARYFYSTFLGTTMAPSAPALNKVFHDTTVTFITESQRQRSEKWELRQHLVSYFKSQESTISARDFADRYLSAEERTPYIRLMREANVPTRALQKDVTFLTNQLRMRRITFSNRVSLTAPAENFDQTITIVEENTNWTTVKISGTVTDDR